MQQHRPYNNIVPNIYIFIYQLHSNCMSFILGLPSVLCIHLRDNSSAPNFMKFGSRFHIFFVSTIHTRRYFLNDFNWLAITRCMPIAYLNTCIFFYVVSKLDSILFSNIPFTNFRICPCCVTYHIKSHKNSI